MFTAFIVFYPIVVFSNPEIITKTFDSHSIKLLRYKNGAGNAKIVGTNEEKLKIVAEKKQFGKNCELIIEQRENELFIEAKNISTTSIFLKGNHCEVDFDITVPKIVSLDLSAGSGNIDLKKVVAKIDAKLGSGNFKGDLDESNNFTLKIGSGNATVKGLTGDAHIKTGSGDMNLMWSKIPVKGYVDIKSGSGDIKITGPKDAKITTDFKSGSGKLQNYIGDSKEAQFLISVFTGSGDLEIDKL